MPQSCGLAVKAAALLLFTSTVSHAQLIGKSPSSPPSPPTCPSTSINYITQTLPQQCLTTSWASKLTTQNSTAVTISRHDGDVLSIPSESSRLEPESPTPVPSFNAPSQTVNSEQVSALPSLADTAKKSGTSEAATPENEVDSPLDNANFLSFEEWKHQNLAKAGQSAENLGARAGGGSEEHRRRPGNINNALDSLGEDSEIDIDFGGFANPGSMNAGMPSQSSGTPDAAQSSSSGEEGNPATEEINPHRRGKDAGKTCKERSNYASFDCAATMLKTNPESKGASAVLVENKDSYLLNICSAKNKFFIVELCDDILIDTVVLANFEFFSSMFRTFRVSVSDRYPVKLDKWRDLGTFEARNTREVQAFLVKNPLIWARYLRVEFLTHFSNEYYCPVSLLRVHGTTMMEEFNHDVKGSRADEDLEGEGSETEESEGNEPSAEVVISITGSDKDEATSTLDPIAGPVTTSDSSETSISPSRPVSSSEQDPPCVELTLHNSTIRLRLAKVMSSADRSDQKCEAKDRESEEGSSTTSTPGSFSSVATETHKAIETTILSANTSMVKASTEELASNGTTKAWNTNTTSQTGVMSASGPQVVTNKSSATLNHSSASTSRSQSSSTQPPASNPTTQESFFKSVHKRLQLLESNSTLSLQYIEEQSRILRDAFAKVEKRQLSKTTTFLETLNTTVLTELRDFRHQYDQIWQSTVLELSSQRAQSASEVLALSARLTLLADELVFQKRIAILQFILLLLCLLLVVFSRTASQTHLEMPPLLQNALTKSTTNLSRYVTLESPPTSPSSTRPSSRYGVLRSLMHRRSPSEESELDPGTKSPGIEYSPPTPESQLSGGEDEVGPKSAGVGWSNSPPRVNKELPKPPGAGWNDDPPAPEEERRAMSTPGTPEGKREKKKELVEAGLLTPERE